MRNLDWILLLLYALLKSALRCWRSRGITWRGTHYLLEPLSAGNRVKL